MYSEADLSFQCCCTMSQSASWLFIVQLAMLTLVVIAAYGEQLTAPSMLSGCNLLVGPPVPCRPRLQVRGTARGTQALLQSNWSLPSGITRLTSVYTSGTHTVIMYLTQSGTFSILCMSGTRVTDENDQIWTVAMSLSVSFATDIPQPSIPIGDNMQLLQGKGSQPPSSNASSRR